MTLVRRTSSMVARLFYIFFLLWLGGCSAHAAPQVATIDRVPVESMEGGAAVGTNDFTRDEVQGQLLDSPPPAPAPGRMAQVAPPQDQPETRLETDATPPRATPLLIYKAQIQLAVFEAVKAIDATEKLALDHGGYLVRRDDHSITIRVPSEKFQSVLRSVGSMGDVLQRNVNAEDVTDQFYDLRIRLRNAEAMRGRLEQLLTRAGSVKEALAVEKELGRVSGEIERLKGKLKLLEELIAFSTITARFQAQRSESINPTIQLPFPWLNQLGLGSLLRL